ncbi:hypothetical protein MKW98_030750 [Papaver atlanticum]|uniref:Dof zinc finger protein n=1 Tax=Papaver atlanticum TaxID=357466 RepID=A0AAD4S0A3_9MAGN|nr:hypothetical protein MKW98_030750 [Papaver atlanticum]
MQDPATYHHQQIKPQQLQLQPQLQQQQPQFPEQEHLKCPRCDSSNTKFCYYNNYNLSQPRHFCKNCRRYWTKGGALRNIPVGGGTRKHTKKSSTPKRISSSTPTPTVTTAAAANSANSVTTAVQFPKPVVSNGGVGINGIGIFSSMDHQMLDISGSFSSLLASNGQFGNLLLDGLNVNPSTNSNQSNGGGGGNIKEVHQFGEFMVENSENLSNNQHLRTTLELQSNTNGGGGNSENLIGLQNGDWGGGGGGGGGGGIVWPDLAIYTPGSNFQ